jgi:hypothetical protein
MSFGVVVTAAIACDCHAGCVDDACVLPSAMHAAPPPHGKPAAPLTLKDGQFWAGGKTVELHGVNWFGFNAHAT